MSEASPVDLLAGATGAVLGHDSPEIAAAAERALRTSLAYDAECASLEAMLTTRLGPELSCTRFTTSPIDAALELAYAATRRANVLYWEKAHHGVTLGALSIMGAEKLRAPYPSIPGTEMVPFGDSNIVESRLKTKKIAAFVVEPIQFEAGIRIAGKTYFRDLAALCAKYGTLLICDESHTGLGRAGSLFAFRMSGVNPDVVVHSSALTNNLVSFGAYSTTVDWQRRARREDQASREGGAFAHAIARRALELVDEPLLERARARGEYLGASLAAVRSGADTVLDVRGQGLLWGVELVPPKKGLARLLTIGLPTAAMQRLYARWVVTRLREKGFITRTAAHDENVILVSPALVVTKEAIDRFGSALAETLEENDRFVKFVRDEGARLVGRRAKA